MVIPIYMGKPGHYHGRGDFFYYLYTDPCITRIHQQDEIKARVLLQSKFPRQACEMLRKFPWVDDIMVNGYCPRPKDIEPFMNKVPPELDGIEPKPCKPEEAKYHKDFNDSYWICHLDSEDPSNDLNYMKDGFFSKLRQGFESLRSDIVLVGGKRDNNFSCFPNVINCKGGTSTMETYSLIKGAKGFVGAASWVFLVSMLENKPVKMLTHNPGYYKEMESWLYPKMVGYSREEITI